MWVYTHDFNVAKSKKSDEHAKLAFSDLGLTSSYITKGSQNRQNNPRVHFWSGLEAKPLLSITRNFRFRESVWWDMI